MSERETLAQSAMSQALHRMGLPECEPESDDYSDEAEHDIAAHDLLDSLAAHGWELARRCGDPHGICLIVGPHEGDHKVPPGAPDIARHLSERGS